MSRKVLILNLITGGVEYGRVVLPSEMMSLQDYAHAHVEVVTRDLLMRNATGPMVAGFDRTLTGLLNISVAAGHAVDAQGLSYETLPAGQATALTLAAAHASLPRIDLVYATLSANQDAESTALPHRRLLTSAEVAAGADPYPIENQNVNTQRQNRAAVAVRQGTPAASPAAPAAGVNEVALFHVLVPAAATVLAAGNVTDVRVQMRSLRDAWVQIDGFATNFANLNETIDDRVNALIAVTADTGLQRAYNDAANTWTLAGVAASTSVMGMMSAADKTKLDNATAAATASRLVTRDANADAHFRRISAFEGGAVYSFTEPRGVDVQTRNAAATTAVQAVATSTGSANESNRAVRAVARFPDASNNGTAVAVDALAEGLPSSAPTGANLFAVRAIVNNNTAGNANRMAIYGEVQGGGGGSQYACYLVGNAHVSGTLSKGGGTFVIDDPHEPNEKTLVHGFVESNRYGLLYYLAVQLVGGEASVDLDIELGFDNGTFEKLCQQAEIVSVRSKGAHAVTASDITFGEPVGGRTSATFDLASADAGDTSEVVVLICAARKDGFIMSDRWVDGQGRLVPSQVKPALTADDEAALEALTVTVPAGHPLAGQTRNELVPSLLGKEGFPYHPSAVAGGAASPTRAVNYEEEEP